MLVNAYGVVIDAKDTPFRTGELVSVNYDENYIKSMSDESRIMEYKSNVVLVVNS